MGGFYIKDGADTVVTYPEFDFNDDVQFNQDLHRPKGGDLYSYMWAKQNKVTLVAPFVNSSSAYLLNNWYSNRTPLSWGWEVDSPNNVTSGYIISSQPPVMNMQRPYPDLFIANIELGN